MEIEWDPEKAERNSRKHGVTFWEAAEVFSDPLELSTYDQDHSMQEDRFVSIGISSRMRLLVVGYTERNGKIRVIFARRASMLERLDYEEA